MKKLLIVLALFLSIGFSANAQMMTGEGAGKDDHTKIEEAEGKEIWEKLQAKELSCDKLSDDNFAVLGEYFMGQMMGDSHSAMNEMITRIHGEEGEEDIHEVMGRRLSGCDTSAGFPAGGTGWMPMMQMMWGGWSAPSSNNNFGPMMYGFNSSMGLGFGILGFIFMILWWVLIIAGLIAFVKWIRNQAGGGSSFGKSTLDILNERYARGEINKQEYEEKKKTIQG